MPLDYRSELARPISLVLIGMIVALIAYAIWKNTRPRGAKLEGLQP